MEISYDKIADALYITLSEKMVFKTAKINDNMLVDLDKKGKILGIEILTASSQISKQKLSAGNIALRAIV